MHDPPVVANEQHRPGDLLSIDLLLDKRVHGWESNFGRSRLGGYRSARGDLRGRERGQGRNGNAKQKGGKTTHEFHLAPECVINRKQKQLSAWFGPKIIFSPLQDAYDGQHEQFQRAFDILQSGIEQRAFPGASVAIAHRGRLVALHGLGHFTYDDKSSAVKALTIYDLASLTKVVATTTACMVLHERGVFHLEQRIVEVLPEFAMAVDRRRDVTFQMLLAPSSGLPAYARLFEAAREKDELVREAAGVPLVADPGSRAEYSDIGFILMGVALERLTQEPLDAFCKREIFDRLEMWQTFFNPPRKPWRIYIPPTSHGQDFRNRIIKGEVQDENAWVMGGVAGHAGVFAPAQDVSLFTHCLLSGGAPLVRPETVELFTRRQPEPAGTSRALGWDTPSQPSQSGRYFSGTSYGHLGYTGTSLWIDPERQLSVTLLTNRTWPDCQSQRIKEIRPAFHDAVIEALK